MKIKKSAHDLSNERKMTFKPDGTLYPIFYQRTLPGDVFRNKTEIFGRMIPLLYPVMQRYDVFVHYFFVPDRLIWNNFREWISPEYATNQPPFTHIYPSFKVKGDNIADDSAAHIGNFTCRSLADCFGIQLNHDPAYFDLPLTRVPDLKFSSMPFRAYQLIWNEHYRDVDIQDPILVFKGDGYSDQDEANQFNFLQRNWEKDYFTSARPFAQKGEPVSVLTHPTPTFNGATEILQVENDGSLTRSSTRLDGGTVKDNNNIIGDGLVQFDTNAGFTIEDLRWANAYQKFTEKLYRVGTRYTQYLKGFFGVKSSDARLDRPEFIGGGRQPFTIGEVLQTSVGTEFEPASSPLGSYGGHAITVGDHKFKYYCEEHGQIIGLLSIMPRASYMNTINKQLLINDVFDYPIPDFAGLGNQEIMKYELSGDLNATTPFEVLGYTDRYAHYKFTPSTVHGLFRKDLNLRNFHAARTVEGDTVALNEPFIQCTASDDTDRVFAVEMSGPFSTDPILCNIINRCEALRPLPRKSIPGLY